MFKVSGFYKFKKIKNCEKHKKKIKYFFLKNNIKGTVTLTPEGINGTIAGKNLNITKCISYIKKILLFTTFDSQNSSFSTFQPFFKAKIKIKKEVVPIGVQFNKHQRRINKYINPTEWNKLISDKSVSLIDLRKPFEYRVGTFKGSINPEINSFRDFPKYFKHLDKKDNIAMFCTGGIRCEKASNFLYKKGFKNIFQLKGGILNYIKNTNKKKSMWKGECFVFDNRVSVKHKLEQGTFSICSGCRMPVSLKEKKSKKYREGISCINCFDKLTNKQIKRFKMRQKQITIAKNQNKPYLYEKKFR